MGIAKRIFHHININKISILIVVALIVVVVILCFIRDIPKQFGSFLPAKDATIYNCQVVNVTEGDLKMETEDLTELLSTLESYKYYDNGYYENELHGNLYHIFLQDKNKNLILAIIISDENIIYIGDRQFTIEGGTKPMIEFFNQLYD